MDQGSIKKLIKETVVEMLKNNELTIRVDVLKGRENESDLISTEIVYWEGPFGETIEKYEAESRSKYFDF